MRKIILAFGLIILSVLLTSRNFARASEHESWPDVLPLKLSIFFSNERQFAAGVYVFGVNGNPRYLIECHDYRYQVDHGFLYSGDFECRLTPLYAKTAYSTLFTDNPNQSRDWQSRARFLSQELVGRCANYPEYGAIRHFRLRKMDITLTMRDIVFGSPAPLEGKVKGRPSLKSFRFDIKVVPDPTATSAITAPVRYRHPPYLNPNVKDDFTLDCATVLRRTKK